LLSLTWAGLAPADRASFAWRQPSARASSIGGGTSPQAQSSAALRKLTIRVAINLNAEALHDAANLAK
jgi:hypothetical protein